MKTKSFKISHLSMAIGLGALALLAAPLSHELPLVSAFDIVSSAQAAGAGGEGKGGSTKGMKGGGHEAGGASTTTESVLTEEEEGSEGHKGHEGGPQHDIDKQKGTPNPGDHGDSESGDGKGPRAGSSGATGGGKPVWAQEGIPEVDLGRLNVARSPAHVLDQAYLEALKTLSSNLSLYQISELQALLDALAASPTRVDSPLENLALYKSLLADGVIEDADGNPVAVTDNTLLLAAFLLGSASDKTVEVTTDTVTAINTILGVELPEGTNLTDFAAMADDVRAAIEDAHNN